MDDEVKLLPCPFCGGSRIHAYGGEAHDVSDEWWQVECLTIGCGCEVGSFDTRAKAVAAWNRRTPAPLVDHDTA